MAGSLRKLCVNRSYISMAEYMYIHVVVCMYMLAKLLQLLLLLYTKWLVVVTAGR